MNQQRHHRTVRSAAGMACLVLVAAACGGSSDADQSDTSVPVTEVAVAPVTAAPVTAAPVVTEAPTVDTIDPADIPSVPCAAYVEESGYPLKPCDSGVLVEALQRDLESLFSEIAIDGLFGAQSFEMIKEFQTAAGLDPSGVVSEELAGQIAVAESLGDQGSEPPTSDAVEATEDNPGPVASSAATAENCAAMVGDPDDPNFSVTMIEDCSALGIDLLGE